MVAVIGLGLGVAIGYNIQSGKTTTTYLTRTTIPGGLSTITKSIVVSTVAHVDAFVCGNSTPYVAGTEQIVIANSTQYIVPSGSARLLNVTVTTEISTQTSISTVIDSTVTLAVTTQSNTTGCPIII